MNHCRFSLPETCAKNHKRVTPVKNIEAVLAGITKENPRSICVGYQDALGEWHETWHKIYLTGRGELAIDFDSMNERDTPAKVCGGQR